MITLQIQGISADELKSFIAETFKEQVALLAPKVETLPGYVTRKIVKERTGLSYPTIIERTKDGTFKGYRTGGRVLYKWDQIEDSLTAIVPKIA